nr:hypothetical protein [Escherichia coli]
MPTSYAVQLQFLHRIVCAGAERQLLFQKIRVTPWSRSRVVTAHISDIFRQRRSME